MKYFLIFIFMVSLFGDDVKLYDTLKKTLSTKEKLQKDKELNKVYIKEIKEDNITKKIQMLIKKNLVSSSKAEPKLPQP